MPNYQGWTFTYNQKHSAAYQLAISNFTSTCPYDLPIEEQNWLLYTEESMVRRYLQYRLD